jgi:hypothetical protein
MVFLSEPKLNPLLTSERAWPETPIMSQLEDGSLLPFKKYTLEITYCTEESKPGDLVSFRVAAQRIGKW